jgi:hypothetical protein
MTLMASHIGSWAKRESFIIGKRLTIRTEFKIRAERLAPGEETHLKSLLEPQITILTNKPPAKMPTMKSQPIDRS